MSVIEQPPVRAPAPASLLDRDYRLPVVGLVIVITVVAVEAMSVATVMPTVVRALHGLRYYSWGFTAYLLADVVGMVDAGRRCDRRGPAPSLLWGLVLFAAGLVVASAAPDMAVFLTGRVLQGLGGGAMIVAVYVVVARAFPESLHPKVFGALSAAWVLPALVGPALAGLVASALSWRWVFAGIAPLAIGGAALLVPVVARIPGNEGEHAPSPHRISRGILLGAGLALVQVAADSPTWWSLAVLAGGLVVGTVPLRRLLPTGALRLVRGLPAAVVLRGILTCAFFGAEAYLPLTLTRVHGGTPRIVGIPLTLGAVGWSAGSAWASRHSSKRATLLRTGFGVVATGIALLVVVATPGASLWLAAPIWAVAGAGMGIAMPTISVLVLDLSPAVTKGASSAALQISDMTGSIIGIAGAGALVTGLGYGSLSTAVTVADIALAAVALTGVFAVTRAVPAEMAVRA